MSFSLVEDREGSEIFMLLSYDQVFWHSFMDTRRRHKLMDQRYRMIYYYQLKIYILVL